MRRAFRLADEAREHGNHPFGALLADPDGSVLIEAENKVVSDSDCAGHAETNLVRAACRTLAQAAMTTATLYTSTEPCAMCAGAIYWAGMSRVVFGLRESELRALTGADPDKPTLALGCRDLFARGQRPIEVVGPVLEDDARAVHDGFWG
jgi:tRNA(Arg) A34 adenosine deaminase TadA